MTPKEKAIELVETYKKIDAIYNTAELGNNVFAIDCAIIAVDEMIKSNTIKGMYDQDYFNAELTYWKEVKKELNEL